MGKYNFICTGCKTRYSTDRPETPPTPKWSDEHVCTLEPMEYDPDIWPVPMERPSRPLGIYGEPIAVTQIPFQYSLLNPAIDFIINDHGEELVYLNKVYRIVTADPKKHLEHWFCKWIKSER